MNTSRNKSISRLFRVSVWIAIFSISVQMPMHSMVLCFGDNGHVSLEYSVEGNCADSPSSHDSDEHAEIKSKASDKEHCGECIDIALPCQNATKIRAAQQQFSTSKALLALSFDYSIRFVGPQATKTAYSFPQQTTSQLITQSLQSVILII